MGALVDSFGRVHTDLRVSLTDKCNLRCTYCMPAEGLDWLPSPDVLTDDEVVRLVSLAVRDLGISAVRLTGGEPLLRRGLVDIVGQLAALEPRPKLALTTNGIGLAKVAGDLAAAGLDRVNVSLDTLRPERFRELSRRDRLDDVLAGLDAARDAGLAPVKVNAVLMRGLNDDEALDLLHYCLDRGFQMRFIEQMPLDAQHGWTRTEMVTADEILTALGEVHALTPVPGRGSAPAEEFVVDGGPATVGVIASVTKPFCAACDRVRLTADGQLRHCLFAREECDPRGPVRAGGVRRARPVARGRHRHRAGRPLPRVDRRQARRARHRRPDLPSARPADVRHRRVTSTPYDALVLAGGRSRRMGGGDKTRLPIDGVSLLDRVLVALPADAGVVVVGEERATSRAVIWTREDPPQAGPAAAVAAGLPLVEGDVVVLLAGDLPLLTTAFLDRLAASCHPALGAVPVDSAGVPQWLCSAWPTQLLRSVDWSKSPSLRQTLGGLPFVDRVVDTDGVVPWLDCDTPEDLKRARELT